MGNSAKDRSDASGKKVADEISINLIGINISNISPVYICTLAHLGRNGIAICTAEPKGIAAQTLQSCNNLLVNEARIDHCNKLKCLKVCNAPAIVHLNLQPQLLGELACNGSASVNKHLWAIQPLKIFEEELQCGRIIYNVSANLYYRNFHIAKAIRS